MTFSPSVPILRIFDEAKARKFWIGFLSFTVDWEHRFDPDAPLYMQVSRDGCVLHLTEHHGDYSPGAAMRMATGNINALQAEWLAKKYAYARPGIEVTPWGSRDLSVKDPFGNRLAFTADV